MRSRGFVGVVAAAMCAVATTASPAMAQDVSYDFDLSNENWTIFPAEVDPAYNATGGNPDGYISYVDEDSGPSEDVQNFLAPSGTLQSSHLGGNLSFDIRSNLALSTFPVAVYLEGTDEQSEPITLVCATTPPVDAWIPNFVVLGADDSCWINSSSGADATAQDFEDLFGGPQLGLQIIADYGEEAGEVVGLDNFQISAPAEFDRKLTIAYSKKARAFSGKLSGLDGPMTPPGCTESAVVDLFEDKGANDKRIDSDVTTSSGKWKIAKKAAKKKKYYAVAASSPAEGGSCAEAKSKVLKPVKK